MSEEKGRSKYQSAIDLLQGAYFAITGHAPAGEKKDQNLKEIGAAIDFLSREKSAPIPIPPPRDDWDDYLTGDK